MQLKHQSRFTKKENEIYVFVDCETTTTSPQTGELISIAMIATDKNYKKLGVFNEKCGLGRPRIDKNIFGQEINLWPDPVGGYDKSKWNATDIHGIKWSEAKDFQDPIDLYRKMWVFFNDLPDNKIRLIYHSQSNYDSKWLFYRSNIWAPKMYQYLVNKTYFYEADPEHGECFHRLRYEDTMGMARKYIKNGSDGLRMAQKLQKTIDKNRGYLDRDGKTPAKPDQIAKWQDALAKAENEMALMEFSEVELEGYSLDKICRSLNIPLVHHNALSDCEALIPIHKFLSQHL